jgi:hypothetical protein
MSNVRLTTWFGVCLLAVLCGGGSLKAYDYADYFTTNKVELDSYRHSVFSPRDQVPPSEPYLYYIDISRNRGLAFTDYKGRDAELRYRFPVAVESAQRVVKGVLALDVSFPSAEISQVIPGHLEYQTSPDGTAWSTAESLEAGHHEIPITSASGYCYVFFSGTRVVIDNLSVFLYSTPVTIRVPRDFATIQAAIDAAVDGDVIELAKNTYSGPGNRDIDFRGKAITVCGAAGAAKDTIIDCGGSTASAEGNHRGFYFHGSEGTDSVLSDVTIRNGRVFGVQVPPDPLRSPSAAYAIGGGIYCEGAGPTIENCIIEDCWADLGGGIGGVGAQPKIADCVIEECVLGKSTTTSGGRGGAIGLIGNSSATITNCIIRGNSGNRSSYGAGLYFQQNSATVVGCVISDNTTDTTGRGGGAYCGAATTNVAFRNCIFSANFANAGAGICAEWAMDTSLPPATRSVRCHVDVVNCTIARNELIGSAMPTSAAGVQSSGADVVVTSSILWFNKGKALVITDSAMRATVTYSDIQGGYSGLGNINLDPQFAAMDSEDYHLKSKDGRYDPQAQRWVEDNVSSPCIDAGDLSASVGDEPTPNGSRINMGAYGGTKQASRSPEHSIFHVDRYRKSGISGAFLTVQAAIDVAHDGDKVLVWPGTYNEDIDFEGKAITVQSAADAAVLTSSGTGTGYAVTFRSGGPGSVLANFVISGCGRAGIFCDAASPTLRDLTIVGNGCGIAAYSGSDPNIMNCIFWNNWDADVYGERPPRPRFSNIQHNTADKSLGNMQTDPLFADPDRGDYHLKSSAGRWDVWSETWVIDSRTSPCIDAGNPRDDYSGEPMPNGGRINMGAYGGTPFASKSNR